MLRTVEWLPALEARLAGLVHRSIDDPAERSRHERFLLVRLTAGAFALAAIPAYLAFRGVPRPVDAAVVLALAAQLGAALVLMRTGSLLLAHALASASYAGFIAAGGWGGMPVAAAALAAVPLDALMSGSRRSAAIAAAIALAALPAAAAVAGMGEGWPPAMLVAVLAAGFAAHAAAQAGEGALLDRRQAAAAARSAHDLPLLQAIDDLVTWHDRNGQVLQASAASTTLLGVPAQALHGRGMLAHVHIGDRPAYLKAISDAAAGGEPVAIEFRLHPGASHGEGARSARRMPQVVWVEMRAHRVAGGPAADAAGCAVVAVTRDISEHRRRADELELARAEAERANALKGRFLATVSHELRTPLNAIIGFSEILAMDPEPKLDGERGKEYARIIRSSGQHLLEVVNTLLDLSKIETGNFDVVAEPFDLAPLVQGCCDLVRLRAEQEGVLLTCDVAHDLPEFVSDRRSCRQILINLLSNAVKFTPRGGRVAVSVRRAQERIVLVVADSGVGIAEDDLSRIGEPFFQACPALARPHEGTGLGLSVVRGLVALHRGTMLIESSPGEGTVVTVSLPVDCRTATPPSGAERVRPLVRPLARLPLLKSA